MSVELRRSRPHARACAVVGAVGATRSVPEGEEVTVSCAEGERGVVYRGRLPFEVEELRPETLPRTRTRTLVNVGTPEEALRTSLLPTDGVGLLRMEFVFASHVRVHPLALTRFETLPKEVRRQVEEVTEAYPDKRAYFVETLSQGIGLIAAAFYPRPVLLRFSDFKTNDSVNLGAFCSHHDDGGCGLFTQLATHINARHFWQHNIKQNEIWLNKIEHLKSLQTVAGNLNTEPFAL